MFSSYENVYVCVMWSLYIGMKAIKHIWCFREWNRQFQIHSKVGRYRDFSHIFCPCLPHWLPSYATLPTPEWSFCYNSRFLTYTSLSMLHHFCESSFLVLYVLLAGKCMMMCVHPHSVLMKASVSLYSSYPSLPPPILQHWSVFSIPPPLSFKISYNWNHRICSIFPAQLHLLIKYMHPPSFHDSYWLYF